MKQKTHSGLKKRVRVRSSGTLSMKKACKNHLLSNKSKRQKKAHAKGLPITPAKKVAVRKMLPYA